MKIAVPLFRKRVSPHFGSSSKVLLVEIQGNSLTQEALWDMGGEGPMEIARRLVELGVEEVICGGIESYYKDWLMQKGVRVVDNQKGFAKRAIRKVLKSGANASMASDPNRNR